MIRPLYEISSDTNVNAQGRVGTTGVLNDGTYEDEIWVNTNRDWNSSDYLTTILHEILHESGKVNATSNFLTGEFIRKHPNLTQDQISETRAIIEELVVRNMVDAISDSNSLGFRRQV